MKDKAKSLNLLALFFLKVNGLVGFLLVEHGEDIILFTHMGKLVNLSIKRNGIFEKVPPILVPPLIPS